MNVEVPNRALPWLAFMLLAVIYYSNFYVYDSIGPVADLLQRQLRDRAPQVYTQE